MSNDDDSVNLKFITFLVFVALGCVGLLGWGCPQYQVYSQRQTGLAALAEAQSSRQIAVAEANAKMESASLLAQADIVRAKGAATANKILGDSLKDNEAYLRYLWIQNLENGTKDGTVQVIYVPTEAGLPILEAGARPLKK